MDQNQDLHKVEFVGEELKRQTFTSYEQKTPKIITWIINNSGGSIKDEKQANGVLLFLILFTMIISLFLFFKKDKATDDVIMQKNFANSPQFLP